MRKNWKLWIFLLVSVVFYFGCVMSRGQIIIAAQKNTMEYKDLIFLAIVSILCSIITVIFLGACYSFSKRNMNKTATVIFGILFFSNILGIFLNAFFTISVIPKP